MKTLPSSDYHRKYYNSEDDARIDKPALVSSLQTGQRGRPAKAVDLRWLRDATTTKRRLTLKNISNTLGIHRNTLRSYLGQHNFSRRYVDISDADLDAHARKFRRQRPSSGYRYFMGYLQVLGVKVQRSRIREALRRVSGAARVLYTHRKIDRQPYRVGGSNRLWHIDGHHKLIRWGIVIHGMIDGHDRMVSI